MATGLPITFASQTSPQMPWLDQMFQAGLVTLTNIAALRANVLSTISQAYLVGYNTPSDQGGGAFVLNSADTASADNGGTIIVDGIAQRWYRQFDGQAITIRYFGAVGDGVTDDSGAAVSMINALGFLRVPADGHNYHFANQVAIGANQVATGGGIISAGSGVSSPLLINGNYGTVSNLTIQMKGCSIGISAQGPIIQPKVISCTFSGLVATGGAHIFFAGDVVPGVYPNAMFNPISQDNVILGNNANQWGGEIFESCTDFVSSRLTVTNQGNHFGVQTRWSSGKISGLRTYNQDIGNTTSGDGSTATFTFTANSGLSAWRTSVILGGVPTIPQTLHNLNSSYTQWTATFASPPSPGELIRFLSHGCPEAIDVNSASSVIIDDYYIDGQDDSGIAFGADYKNTGSAWIVAAGSQADWPTASVIGAGRINNVFNAGVATTVPVAGLVFSGGHYINNYGMQADANHFYDNAIAISNASAAGFFTLIQRGIIDNTVGFGMGGILATPGGDDGTPNKLLTISQQDYRGTFPRFRENLSGGQTTNGGLLSSIHMSDRTRRPWPQQPDFTSVFAQSGAPVTSTYLSYVPIVHGATQSDAAYGAPFVGNGVTLAGGRSLQTIAGSSLGIYVLGETSGGSRSSHSVASFRFMAITTASATPGTASFVYLSAAFQNGSFGSSTIYTITNTSWQEIEVTASMLGAAYLSSVMIGCPVGGVQANIQDPDLGLYDLIL